MGYLAKRELFSIFDKEAIGYLQSVSAQVIEERRSGAVVIFRLTAKGI